MKLLTSLLDLFVSAAFVTAFFIKVPLFKSKESLRHFWRHKGTWNETQPKPFVKKLVINLKSYWIWMTSKKLSTSNPFIHVECPIKSNLIFFEGGGGRTRAPWRFPPGNFYWPTWKIETKKGKIEKKRREILKGKGRSKQRTFLLFTSWYHGNLFEVYQYGKFNGKIILQEGKKSGKLTVSPQKKLFFLMSLCILPNAVCHFGGLCFLEFLY